MSDLHLDVNQGNKAKEIIELIAGRPDVPHDRVIFIAGDISNLEYDWIDFLTAIRFYTDDLIFLVMGNHDYYGGTLDNNRIDLIRGGLPHGAFLLENNHFKMDGVHVLGCTLWTDFCRNTWGHPIQNDQDNILAMDGSSISVDDFIKKHNDSVSWLSHEMDKIRASKEGGRIAIITHHLPIFLDGRKDGDKGHWDCNYSSNLSRMIEEYQPDLWVHGHSHTAHDTMINQTKVASNPIGYDDEDNPMLIKSALIY